MEKTSLNKALALFIAAQVMTVGCGDGGKPRRQPINRSGLQKGTGQNLSKPGQSALSNPKDLQVKSEKINKMKNELSVRTAGTAVTAQQLEEGLYSLEEVTSHLEYHDTPAADEVRILNVYNVTNTNNSVELNKVGGETAGLISNSTDMGRQLVIPYKFYVQGLQGQPWQPQRDLSVSEVLFATAVQIKSGASVLSDTFRPRAESLFSETSIFKALAGQPVMTDKETSYEFADRAGKKIQIRLRKGNDGKLRMGITALETKERSSDGKYMLRTIVLTYGREALAQDKKDNKPAITGTDELIEQPTTAPTKQQ